MTHELGKFRVSSFEFRVSSRVNPKPETRNPKRSSRRGQALVEHAIVLVSLFAAVIAMSTYARRGMQARYRTLVDGAVTAIGAPTQYEPYYASASSTSTQDSTGTFTYAPGGAVTFIGQETSVIDPGAKQRVGVELHADDAWQ